jgi:hypothetical protein
MAAAPRAGPGPPRFEVRPTPATKQPRPTPPHSHGGEAELHPGRLGPCRLPWLLRQLRWQPASSLPNRPPGVIARPHPGTSSSPKTFDEQRPRWPTSGVTELRLLPAECARMRLGGGRGALPPLGAALFPHRAPPAPSVTVASATRACLMAQPARTPTQPANLLWRRAAPVAEAARRAVLWQRNYCAKVQRERRKR